MTSVPCNGCTACCKHDLIMLHEEMGDIPQAYACEPMTNPLTGFVGWALKRKADGSCIYLGETGCSIHGRAPAVCKEFDCRLMLKNFLSIPRPERRRLQKTLRKRNLMSQEVVEAALERMHTLEDDVA